MGIGEVGRKKETGEDWFNIMMQSDRERQRRERWERINKVEFNEWYKLVKEDWIPEYLKKI